MSVGLKHSHYWEEKVVPPPPPPSQPSHGPHDWRAVNPRVRRFILRGLLPEEFANIDLTNLLELEKLLELLDSLDSLDN